MEKKYVYSLADPKMLISDYKNSWAKNTTWINMYSSGCIIRKTQTKNNLEKYISYVDPIRDQQLID